MRKVLKILHTLAACGLIGGLGCYMILLYMAPHESPAAYAGLRQAIASVSNYLLLPSLAIATVSGLLSMMVHRPFLDKGWVWFKAALGILMFKGVLTIVGAKANEAAVVSRKIADGEPAAKVLDAALFNEWATLGVVLVLSVANVVVGIWRPRFGARSQSQAKGNAPPALSNSAATIGSKHARPAA